LHKNGGACKDGRGGLPSTIGISQEARTAALNGCARVFDTFFDTIFISDPMFTIRKKRNALLEMGCMTLFKNVAFSSVVHEGLQLAHQKYPTLCNSPAAVLRPFDRLEHFSIIIFEFTPIGSDVDESDNEEQLDSEDDQEFRAVVEAGYSRPKGNVQRRELEIFREMEAILGQRFEERES